MTQRGPFQLLPSLILCSPKDSADLHHKWITLKKMREESQAFSGSKYFCRLETDCLASGLACLKWMTILTAELKPSVCSCWCFLVAVEMVKSVRVKSLQIYQNTYGQKQGQALDSQTSFICRSEAGSATDLLYELLSYCSQCIFLKVHTKKNPWIHSNSCFRVFKTEELNLLQRNWTCRFHIQ